MLYIHSLSHLTPRIADLESVYLIREIKQRTSHPLSEEKMKAHFLPFFISDTDLKHMESALQLVEPTIERVKELRLKNDPAYEPINLQRSIQILKEMPAPLDNNRKYLQNIFDWQGNFAGEVVPILNRLPRLKTREEKESFNQQLNPVFQLVLRNSNMVFNAQDIINEAQLSHITGLSESLQKGFLFRLTLEEELKKQEFGNLRARLAKERLDEVEAVQKNVELIKKGIERAYENNMRMVNWAVLLYTYVKWLVPHP